jgi:hypothetical protein
MRFWRNATVAPEREQVEPPGALSQLGRLKPLPARPLALITPLGRTPSLWAEAARSAPRRGVSAIGHGGGQKTKSSDLTARQVVRV